MGLGRIGYSVCHSGRYRPHRNFTGRPAAKVSHDFGAPYFWPANWFILTIGSAVPPLINPAFGRTVLGHNLSRLSSGILTLSTIFLIVIFVIDWRIKPPKPKRNGQLETAVSVSAMVHASYYFFFSYQHFPDLTRTHDSCSVNGWNTG